MSVGICKSTRYGPGCGHPTSDHVGQGVCCCCNWQQNSPSHVEECARCKPILDAYLARYARLLAHADCGHALGLCRYA